MPRDLNDKLIINKNKWLLRNQTFSSFLFASYSNRSSFSCPATRHRHSTTTTTTITGWLDVRTELEWGKGEGVLWKENNRYSKSKCCKKSLGNDHNGNPPKKSYFCFSYVYVRFALIFLSLFYFIDFDIILFILIKSEPIRNQRLFFAMKGKQNLARKWLERIKSK